MRQDVLFDGKIRKKCLLNEIDYSATKRLCIESYVSVTSNI